MYSLQRRIWRNFVCAGLAIGLASPGMAGAETSEIADPPAVALPLAPSPLGHYLAARQAQKLRDTASAADLMAFTLAADPQNAELLQGTFVLMTSEGRIDEAAELARRFKAQGGRLPTAALALALQQVKAGDREAAADELSTLSRDGLGDLFLPMVRGWLLVEPGNAERALAALAPLGEIAGVAPLYHLHAALLNDHAGRAAAAAVSYRQLAESATQPSLRLVQLIGNFHLRQGSPEDARAVYERFADANPGNPIVEPLLAELDSGTPPAPIIATPRDGIAEAMFNIATVLYQENAADMALLFTRMALDMRPDYPIAAILLADIYAERGRTEESMRIYRRLGGDPMFGWQARMSEAENLNELEQTDAAVALLRAMAAERPTRPDAPTRLGNILRNHERFAEAAEAYDMAVERIGEPQSDHWSTYYFRGIARERSKQWDAAEADFLKALELEPEQPYVLNYLAYSWADQGRNFERALEMLTKAVSQKPDDGYIVDSLGWVLYRLRRFDEAVKQLERAIELKPDDPVINDHLGDAYWHVGRKVEARFQWQRALLFEPEADQVGLIEGKIERGLARGPSGS